ncbi:hypothetical protein [Chitinophaga polysaccharea]|uniref:hypothetical protein n=1 Tax=Chitinophaga polysaccharea TaxID=1293035 RepID=UPI0011589BC6|nr:hypothetical protein [Chitinophaga polysaccharea]
MDFFDSIKNIFRKKNKEINERTYAGTDARVEAYIEKHLKEVNSRIPGLEELYGTDFYQFFYRPDAGEFIRKELLDVLGISPVDCFDNDHWEEKHPFNFPGPFYTGESDTCGTGETEAPFNVLFDANCMEYVFRQPKNYAELLCVIDAGAVEVRDSYSCNGNNHWTYSECKNWWANRENLILQLSDAELSSVNRGKEQLYINYLNSDAAHDLRKYCFFLENNFYPGEGVALPEL